VWETKFHTHTQQPNELPTNRVCIRWRVRSLTLKIQTQRSEEGQKVPVSRGVVPVTCVSSFRLCVYWSAWKSRHGQANDLPPARPPGFIRPASCEGRFSWRCSTLTSKITTVHATGKRKIRLPPPTWPWDYPLLDNNQTPTAVSGQGGGGGDTATNVFPCYRSQNSLQILSSYPPPLLLVAPSNIPQNL
jgi:hypothetical protein